jgi:hypothetical protein
MPCVVGQLDLAKHAGYRYLATLISAGAADPCLALRTGAAAGHTGMANCLRDTHPIVG